MEIASRDKAPPVDVDDDVDSDLPAGAAGDAAAAESSTVDKGLPDSQRDILDFERQWWRRPGAKEQAIRDRFDLSATRYYQQLNTLLDQPAALAYDPATVRRLRRLRATRRHARGGS